jgi:hypothetical protein
MLEVESAGNEERLMLLRAAQGSLEANNCVLYSTLSFPDMVLGDYPDF